VNRTAVIKKKSTTNHSHEGKPCSRTFVQLASVSDTHMHTYMCTFLFVILCFSFPTFCYDLFFVFFNRVYCFPVCVVGVWSVAVDDPEEAEDTASHLIVWHIELWYGTYITTLLSVGFYTQRLLFLCFLAVMVWFLHFLHMLKYHVQTCGNFFI